MDSIDLSKATRLKDICFVSDLYPHWISSTLRTLAPNHQNLQICVDLPSGFDYLEPEEPIDALKYREFIGEVTYSVWLELDHFLVQLWESNLARTEVTYRTAGFNAEDTRNCIESLFPKLLKSGTANFIPEDD